MAKIYLVIHSWAYEGINIEGVFTSLRKAVDHRDSVRKNVDRYSLNITEWVDIEVWDTDAQESEVIRG